MIEIIKVKFHLMWQVTVCDSLVSHHLQEPWVVSLIAVLTQLFQNHCCENSLSQVLNLSAQKPIWAYATLCFVFFLILLQIFGAHLFGEFELNTVLLSQRYSTDCTGYYTSAGSLSFSWASVLQIIRCGNKSEKIITMILPFCSHRAKVECYAH